MNWYYLDGNRIVGPLGRDALAQLRSCGAITAETPVAREGSAEWHPCDNALSSDPHQDTNGQGYSSDPLAALAAGIGAMAGVNTASEHGGFKTLFRDLLKKRTIEEMEAQFAAGCGKSAPHLWQVNVSWPAPWVFSRLILFAVVSTLGFTWLLVKMQDPVVVPGWIFTGAFGIPFAVLFLFMETNVVANVSFYRILKLFMLGGMLSLIFTTLLNEQFRELYGWLGNSGAGPIEEVAKILAVTAFAAKWRDKHWMLNGMLFGAAVGAGFAAFETAGYILRHADESHQVDPATVMIMRALFAPFTHVIWTAAAGAALWKIKGTMPFSPSMLWDWGFLRVMLISVVLHMLWNSDFGIPLAGPVWSPIVKQAILGVIGWVLILLLIQDGLNQIREAKAQIPAPAGQPSVETIQEGDASSAG